jgi:predicted ATPase
LSPEQAMASPAVQLFAARAAARLDGFQLGPEEAPLVAAICRRLDGIALAIELAAGRVDTFGVRGVHQLLDDRFRLLVVGRRTALPRHQTLRAALSWSFDLLGEEDRRVLCRLAIFAGPFTLDSAGAILAADDAGRRRVVQAIGNLVAKSLVSADLRNGPAQYRLLETTRAFALNRLRAEGDAPLLARRHAEYFRDRMQEAEAAWERSAPEEWVALYGRDLCNVRAAHDWAFSPEGDRSIGLALTAAAAVLWFQLSLLVECRARFETALPHLGQGDGADPRLDMRVLAALGASLLYTIGPGPEIDEVWNRAYALAEREGDVAFKLRALWGLCISRLSDGRFTASLAAADALTALAIGEGDAANAITGHRVSAITRIYLGQLDGAAAEMRAALERETHGSHVARVPFNQQLTARAYGSQVLWLRGFPAQALAEAGRSVQDARELGQALSLSLTLAESGCPIPQMVGDLPMLERHVALMADNAAKYPFGPWMAWATCFRGGLLAAQGRPEEGAEQLREGLALLQRTRWQVRRTMFLGDLALALHQAGQPAPAQAALAEALERAARDEEAWCVPELRRRQAALLLGRDQPDEAAAELLEALALAERQGSLSWALRIGTDLARLRHPQGRDLLARILSRFTEGFDLPDLRAAATLLGRPA